MSYKGIKIVVKYTDARPNLLNHNIIEYDEQGYGHIAENGSGNYNIGYPINGYDVEINLNLTDATISELDKFDKLVSEQEGEYYYEGYYEDIVKQNGVESVDIFIDGEKYSGTLIDICASVS